MLEHAGQSDMHQADNVEKEPSELGTREILPQRKGGKDGAKNKGGKDDRDGKRRDNAYRPSVRN